MQISNTYCHNSHPKLQRITSWKDRFGHSNIYRYIEASIKFISNWQKFSDQPEKANKFKFQFIIRQFTGLKSMAGARLTLIKHSRDEYQLQDQEWRCIMSKTRSVLDKNTIHPRQRQGLMQAISMKSNKKQHQGKGVTINIKRSGWKFSQILNFHRKSKNHCQYSQMEAPKCKWSRQAMV